jgi:hypothetical protein
MSGPAQPPRAFRQRLRKHNSAVLVGTFVALLGAAIAWLGLYYAVLFFTLGIDTIIRGEAAELPPNFLSILLTISGVLLLLYALRRSMPGYRRLRDRPILGWHLVLDLLLLPATLTFATVENLTAFRRLPDGLCRDSWHLLVQVFLAGKMTVAQLGGLGLNKRRTEAICFLLQINGLLDLHAGADDWFYLVPSPEHDFIRRLMQEEGHTGAG